MTKSHKRRKSLDWPNFFSAQGVKAYVWGHQCWKPQQCPVQNRSLANQDSFFSCVILSLKRISKQNIISLILFKLFQQARTTSFQVTNKAILSGISAAFTLVKQGYINKTAFSWNLLIPCIILFIVLFHVLVTFIAISSSASPLITHKDVVSTISQHNWTDWLYY